MNTLIEDHEHENCVQCLQKKTATQEKELERLRDYVRRLEEELAEHKAHDA